MSLNRLRRLLGPPAQQPDVHVHATISPGCVIRPGDTVVLCLPDPAWVKPAVVRAAKEHWLPKGAGLVVFCGEGAAAMNLSRFLQGALDQHRCDAAGDADHHCAGDRPEGPADATGRAPGAVEDALVPVDRLASGVLPDELPVPEPALKPSHGEASP